jgi:hypothetical protein
MTLPAAAATDAAAAMLSRATTAAATAAATDCWQYALPAHKPLTYCTHTPQAQLHCAYGVLVFDGTAPQLEAGACLAASRDSTAAAATASLDQRQQRQLQHVCGDHSYSNSSSCSYSRRYCSCGATLA